MKWPKMKNNSIRKAVNLLLASLVLASMVIPMLPQREAKALGWADASYSRRIDLSGNMSAVSSNLTNLPTLVHLTASNVNFSLITNGIAFYDSDDTTQLPFEIDTNNLTASLAAQDLYIWIAKTWQGSTNYTDKMRMYYGKSSGSLQSYNPTSVWDSNYVGVWHYGDNLTSTTRIEDSTSNSNNATKLSAGNPLQTTGLIANSQNFSSDSINYGISIGVSPNLTFEALINPNSAAALTVIGSKFAGGDLSWAIDYATDKKIDVFVTPTAGGWDWTANSTTTAELNQWSYLGVAFGTPPYYLKSHGGSVVYGGKLWMVGGENTLDPNTPNSILAVYDPSTNTYEQKASMATARWGGTSSIVGTVMYHMGGNVNSTTGSNANEAYDLINNTWSVKSNVPALLSSQGITSSVYNGNIYAFYQNYVSMYNPVGDNWTTKTNSTANLTWSTPFTIGNYIYLIGGSDSTNLAVNTVRRYDPNLNSWDDAYDTIPVGAESWAGLVNTAYDATSLYWGFGRFKSGGNFGNRKTLYLYVPATKTWTAKTSGVIEGNAFMSGIIGDNLYVLGYGFINGLNETPYTVKQVYSISGNSWTSASLSNFNVNLNGNSFIANSGNGTHRLTAAPMYVGNFQGGSSWFPGLVDEVRLSNIYRSNDWLTATWMNETGNFLKYESSILPSVVTNSAQNISMTKDGVVSGNFSGNITSLGSELLATARINYGLTAAYGTNTTDVDYNSTGNILISLPAILTPGQTYHYRVSANNTVGTVNDSDSTFTLTMPFVSTGSPTNVGTTATLTGDTTSMGVASSTYRYFEWYQTGGPVFTTPLATGTAIGSYSDTITFDPLKTLNIRAVNQVGTVKSYGSWATLEIGSVVTGGNFIWQIIPLLVATSVIITVLVLSMKEWTTAVLLTGIISGILAYVVTYMLIRIVLG